MNWIDLAIDVLALLTRLVPEGDPVHDQIAELREILAARAAADAAFAARTGEQP